MYEFSVTIQINHLTTHNSKEMKLKISTAIFLLQVEIQGNSGGRGTMLTMSAPPPLLPLNIVLFILFQILHVSGSIVIKQRVKNAEIHVLDRCGHAVTLDRPRKLVKIITQFLEKVTTT
jgi:hypothetical protein